MISIKNIMGMYFILERKYRNPAALFHSKADNFEQAETDLFKLLSNINYLDKLVDKNVIKIQ